LCDGSRVSNLDSIEYELTDSIAWCKPRTVNLSSVATLDNAAGNGAAEVGVGAAAGNVAGRAQRGPLVLGKASGLDRE
jgi:hypothetical protein